MRFSLPTRKKHEVEILLLRDVKNIKQVVTNMLGGTFPATLVNAAMVADLFIVLVAASSALRRYDDGDRVTKNIYTDILYQLSPTRNISLSLKTFGVSDKTKDIVIIVPDPTHEKIDHIRKHIQADEVEASELPKIHSTETHQVIQKFYSITREELESSPLVDSVVTRMACRDIK